MVQVRLGLPIQKGRGASNPAPIRNLAQHALPSVVTQGHFQGQKPKGAY